MRTQPMTEVATGCTTTGLASWQARDFTRA